MTASSPGWEQGIGANDADSEQTSAATPPPARTGVAASAQSTRAAIQQGIQDLHDDTAPIRRAQEDWAQMATEARGVLHDAATWWGEATSTVTAFLAPVPAMLLMFISHKVLIPIPIPVMFKPEKLGFSKSADWDTKHRKGQAKGCKTVGQAYHDVPQATFKGGGPEVLDLELFFDTTDTQVDVRLHLKPIQMLVYKAPFMDEPPLVMFSWGMMLSKISYVEEVEIEYTMFRADGTPLRAEVNLSLTEKDMGWLSRLPMNPTSYSEARKTWVVIEGQTLDWIAYQEYGNAAHWRHIAKVNNLENPRDLRSGQILKLTPLN